MAPQEPPEEFRGRTTGEVVAEHPMHGPWLSRLGAGQIRASIAKLWMYIHWHARCTFETDTVIIGEAETFRFTAQELEHQQANWTPQDVEIHRGH